MIGIIYKCKCRPEEHTVDVANRKDSVDVVDWVQVTVSNAIAADHRKRSPWCRATHMEYVRIPAPENAPFLGGTPKLDS